MTVGKIEASEEEFLKCAHNLLISKAHQKFSISRKILRLNTTTKKYTPVDETENLCEELKRSAESPLFAPFCTTQDLMKIRGKNDDKTPFCSTQYGQINDEKPTQNQQNCGDKDSKYPLTSDTDVKMSTSTTHIEDTDSSPTSRHCKTPTEARMVRRNAVFETSLVDRKMMKKAVTLSMLKKNMDDYNF